MPHPHHHQGLVFGYKRSCDELTTGGKQCFPPNQSVLLHVVLVYSFKLNIIIQTRETFSAELHSYITVNRAGDGRTRYQLPNEDERGNWQR